MFYVFLPIWNIYIDKQVGNSNIARPPEVAANIYSLFHCEMILLAHRLLFELTLLSGVFGHICLVPSRTWGRVLRVWSETLILKTGSIGKSPGKSHEQHLDTGSAPYPRPTALKVSLQTSTVNLLNCLLGVMLVSFFCMNEAVIETRESFDELVVFFFPVMEPADSASQKNDPLLNLLKSVYVESTDPAAAEVSPTRSYFV